MYRRVEGNASWFTAAKNYGVTWPQFNHSVSRGYRALVSDSLWQTWKQNVHTNFSGESTSSAECHTILRALSMLDTRRSIFTCGSKEHHRCEWDTKTHHKVSWYTKLCNYMNEIWSHDEGNAWWAVRQSSEIVWIFILQCVLYSPQFNQDSQDHPTASQDHATGQYKLTTKKLAHLSH